MGIGVFIVSWSMMHHPYPKVGVQRAAPVVAELPDEKVVLVHNVHVAPDVM